jgi:hypothetical protein
MVEVSRSKDAVDIPLQLANSAARGAFIVASGVCFYHRAGITTRPGSAYGNSGYKQLQKSQCESLRSCKQ